MLENSLYLNIFISDENNEEVLIPFEDASRKHEEDTKRIKRSTDEKEEIKDEFQLMIEEKLNKRFFRKKNRKVEEEDIIAAVRNYINLG